MDKRRLSLWISILGLLVVAGFAFVASQLLPVSAISQLLPPAAPDALVQQQQAIPTPVGAITNAPLQVMPTRADLKPRTTPTLIPATKVKTGTVTQVQQGDLAQSLPSALSRGIQGPSKYPLVAFDSTGRYAVSNGSDTYDSYLKVLVRDVSTGQEVHLGNDAGSAFAAAVADKYILWWFHCYDSCETNPIRSGLYVYDLQTRGDIALGELGNRTDFKADGRWISYIKPTTRPGPSRPATYVTSCLGDLYAYHLDTKKELFVSGNVPWHCGPDQDFYAISDNRVVWSQLDRAAPNHWVIRMRDLVTGQTQTVFTSDVPEVPKHLSFSGDYIMWWPWFGFDLKQNALFNVSTNVPGWEKVRTEGDGPVVVKNDRIYWFKIVNRKTYYFTAPLVRVTNPYPGP